MRKVCLFNQNNNSTLSLNIFSKLAKQGKRILIVDLRENKSDSNSENDIGLNIKTCFSENRNPSKYITSLENNLDIIKGNSNLNLEEFEMFHELFRYDYIEKKFSKLHYDYLIFEVSPQLNLLTMNVLYFVNEVMSIINLEKSGIEFIHKLSAFLSNFNRIHHKKLFISKIIPTFCKNFEKKEFIHLVSSFTSKMISFPISSKKDKEFSSSLNEISKSLLEDGKIFDAHANSKEKQKLVNEYLEILRENSSSEIPLNHFVKN